MDRIGAKLGIIALVAAVTMGAVVGAIVGATLAATRSTTTIIYKSRAANPDLTSVDRVVVPVSNDVNVVKRAGPAVVSIEHQLPTSVDPQTGFPTGGGTAIGSGFIIDTQGDIVTNDHVIQGGNPHYTVTFQDGRTAPAILIGGNPSYDVAVIRVKGAVPATVQWGDSSYVQPGQPVVAIGDALGQFPNTVTSGIVSGLHRVLSSQCLSGASTCPQDYIQTDAPINHGNSGGPLLDLDAQVVGINTAIQRSTGETGTSSPLFLDPFENNSDPNSTVAEGLGFAIPSDTAAPLAEHMIHHTPLPYLGVCYRPITLLAESSGIPAGAEIVTGCSRGAPGVSPGSPAAKAGIRANDVIVAVGPRRLSNGLTLIQAVLPENPGQTASIRIWRPNSPTSTKGHYLTRAVKFGKS